VVIYKREDKVITFKYSNYHFDYVEDNSRDFGEIESDIKCNAGLGQDIEFTGFGQRKICKGEKIFDFDTITIMRTNSNMIRQECNLFDLTLYLRMGNLKMRTKIKCFDGWNKRGLINHIGRVVGVKNGLFQINSNSYQNDFNSIFYYGSFKKLRAVYKKGNSQQTGLNFLSIENNDKLGLWQFRFRSEGRYSFLTFGKNFKIGDMIRIIKFVEKVDYITCGTKLLNEDDQNVISTLKWGSELISHRRLNGGSPIKYDWKYGTSRV
jgi:hypothetical protein